MSAIQPQLTGIIHGMTIQLSAPVKLPDGAAVRVQLELIDQEPSARLERLRQSIGAWSDDADGLDEFLAWNRQQRKVSRREISQ